MKKLVKINLQNLQIENMSQLDLKIGPKIKAFRRQLGLQANKLAEELSISPSYLNLILQFFYLIYKLFTLFYSFCKLCKL